MSDKADQVPGPFPAMGNECSIGAWCWLPDPLAMEVVAHAGYDYACVDLQHGLVDFGRAITMLQVLDGHGAVPVVRVRSNDPWEIMQVLDAGARAVIVPMIEDGASAAAAAAAFRYPPHGIRSFGPARAALVTRTRDLDRLSEVSCLVMIETAQGLDKVEEVASTPGVDGIYIGPSDLSLSLLGEVRPPGPWLDEPLEAIRDACRRHGLAVGLHCPDGQTAAEYIARGLDMVTVATDLNVLRAGLDRERMAARPSGPHAR